MLRIRNDPNGQFTGCSAVIVPKGMSTKKHSDCPGEHVSTASLRIRALECAGTR